MSDKRLENLRTRFVESFYENHRIEVFGHPGPRLDQWDGQWEAVSAADPDKYYSMSRRDRQAHITFSLLSDIDPSPDKIYLERLCAWYGREIPYWFFTDVIKERLVRYHETYGYNALADFKVQSQPVLRRRREMRAAAKPAHVPISFASAERFVHSFDRFMARRDFLARPEERLQRDRKFVDGQNAELICDQPTQGLRVYLIKTEIADQAFGVSINPVRPRENKYEAVIYRPPYYQIELADGSRLRTIWQYEERALSLEKTYSHLLVDETDRYANLHALMQRYPVLVSALRPYIEERLRFKPELDPMPDLRDRPAELDWNTLGLVSKIPALHDLLTPEMVEEGIEKLRASRRVWRGFAVKELKAIVQVSQKRNLVPGEAIRDIFVCAIENQAVGVAQNILSVIATDPEWRAAVTIDDLRPLFSDLGDENAKPCRGSRGIAGVLSPLTFFICNIAKLPHLQGAGEEKYLNMILKRLAWDRDWPKIKTILANALQNKLWHDHISTDTRQLIEECQDNAAKVHKIDMLLKRLDGDFMEPGATPRKSSRRAMPLARFQRA